MATEPSSEEKHGSCDCSFHEKLGKEITIYGATVIKYHYCNNSFQLTGTSTDNISDNVSSFSSVEHFVPEGDKEGNRWREPLETSKQSAAADADDFDSILSTKRQCRLVLRRIAYITFMNALIPIVLYMVLKRHLPPVWALVLSTTPTIVSVTLQGIFWRRIDTVGIASISGKIKACTRNSTLKKVLNA